MLVDQRARAVILVEGWSDQAALEALARRRGRDLLAEGVVVMPIGGAARASSPPSVASRTSPRSAAANWTPSCAGSWAPAPDARCATAPLLVEALDLDRVPLALDGVLEDVRA